jgi:hypothetical protein
MMCKKILLVGLLMAVTPALAEESVQPNSPVNASPSERAPESPATPAPGGQFYIQQNTSTKECDIGQTQPDGTKEVMIGTTYSTKAEAVEARKAAPECQGHFGQG